jgi:hypothetical protein
MTRPDTSARFVVQLVGRLRDRLLSTALDRLDDHDEVLRQHERRLNRWERHMAELEDFVSTINEATNRAAEGQRAIAVQLNDLRARVAAGDTRAIELLGPVANRLNEHADALFAMASAGPENPTPAPIPDTGPVDEPTDTVPTEGDGTV